MAKAAMKTVPTRASVASFIAAVGEREKRQDCRELSRWMREITGKRAMMWGPSIVGFGRYHYVYASGREGDYFVTGFSPRAQSLTVYIMPGFSSYAPLLRKLGKHKVSKSCLYLKRLDDIDRPALYRLIERSVCDMHRMYECA